jgi:hypothetical protein
MANSENTEEQEINCELENPDREALNILMLVKYLSIGYCEYSKNPWERQEQSTGSSVEGMPKAG